MDMFRLQRRLSGIGSVSYTHLATEIKRQELHRSYVALEKKGEGIKRDGIEKQMPEISVYEAGSDEPDVCLLYTSRCV